MTFFRPAVALVFFSFVCASFDAGASDSLTRLLEQAETARSADPAKFRRILERLNEQAGSATESEGERIQYLNAYSYAFQGKHDLAIDTAKRLFDTSKDPDMRFRVGALIVNAYAVNR